MNRKVFYALIFFGACAFATLSQVNSLKVSAADSVIPLTSPITPPVVDEDPVKPQEPITPPVITIPLVVSGGGSNNNNGSGSSSNNGGGSNSSSCSTEAPKNAPVIFKALSTGKNQITLFYTKPEGQVTTYAVVYGAKKGVYTFGLSGISGAQNAVAINGLTRGAVYYFKIQGVNGCAAGPFSQEISIKVGSNSFTQVLGTKTINKNFKPVKSFNSTPKPFMSQAPVVVPAPKNPSFFQSFLNLFN